MSIPYLSKIDTRIIDYISEQLRNKNSALYFMVSMTQKEFEEMVGRPIKVKPYKFNKIKYG